MPYDPNAAFQFDPAQEIDPATAVRNLQARNAYQGSEGYQPGPQGSISPTEDFIRRYNAQFSDYTPQPQQQPAPYIDPQRIQQMAEVLRGVPVEIQQRLYERVFGFPSKENEALRRALILARFQYGLQAPGREEDRQRAQREQAARDEDRKARLELAKQINKQRTAQDMVRNITTLKAEYLRYTGEARRIQQVLQNPLVDEATKRTNQGLYRDAINGRQEIINMVRALLSGQPLTGGGGGEGEGDGEGEVQAPAAGQSQQIPAGYVHIRRGGRPGWVPPDEVQSSDERIQ